MQHAKTRLFSLKWESQLLYYSTRGCLKLSFHILFMFLGHTSPKIGISVNVGLGKITEPRKKQLKMEILHALKEF